MKLIKTAYCRYAWLPAKHKTKQLKTNNNDNTLLWEISGNGT
jgi:hypothetical protein